jgi:hypothetical protein
MTIFSNLKPLNTGEFRKSLQIFDTILDILGEFENNYERRLNFSKLVELLKIPKSEIDGLINLVLHFQEKFNYVFIDYKIQKIRVNGDVYLTVKKKNSNKAKIPLKITISRAQLEQFNDIFYTFKYVKRGGGFDITKNRTKISTYLKKLNEGYPYLFEEKANGLIYPSNFGIKLGDLIISYNKSNRAINILNIGEIAVLVINDG